MEEESRKVRGRPCIRFTLYALLFTLYALRFTLYALRFTLKGERRRREREEGRQTRREEGREKKEDRRGGWKLGREPYRHTCTRVHLVAGVLSQYGKDHRSNT